MTTGKALDGKPHVRLDEGVRLAKAIMAAALLPVFAASADSSQVEIAPAYRSAFVRGETGAVFRVTLRNAGETALSEVRVRAVQRGAGGKEVAETALTAGDIAAGGDAEVAVPVETRLAPGWRRIDLSVRARSAAGASVSAARSLDYGIGPAQGDRMIVQMWHYNETNTNATERHVADFGFTHGFNKFGIRGIKKLSPEWKQEQIRRLDRAVMEGMMLTGGIDVAYPKGQDKDLFMRKDRNGNVIRHKVRDKMVAQPDVSDPALLSEIRDFTEKEATFLSPHPGFAGVLPVTELRDHSYPSFVGGSSRYKFETGRDVPWQVTNKVWSLALAQKRFPDGVVPDDDEILLFYTWFWRGGDGWPGFIGAAAEAFKKRFAAGDEYRFSFWDPAVRCPPIWGSGGAVDMLNQWCYANPEPMNVAGPAEEMLAMTSGRPGQRTSIMTQLICYRVQVAPKGVAASPEPEWLSRLPEANFVTIAPDVLSEATWSMIAKPVDAVMFHGWGTVFDTGEQKGYCFTNGDSAKRLKQLIKDVITPLGPVLKRLKREQPRVAVLESFTTVAMGGPGSWGWTAPAVTYLQRARLDPRVVYEDSIRRGDLKDVKVLYAPQCRFLPKSLVEEIRRFQRRGGILLGDDLMVSALTPDVKVPVVSFAPPPKIDHIEGLEELEKANKETDRQKGTRMAKAQMVAQAEQLRRSIAGRYEPASDSSSSEIVVYNRRGRGADYLFAVNDRRTFGDYVGQWGRVMERGLPFSGSVVLRGAADRVGAVYELSRGECVPFRREGGDVCVDVAYKTCDGRMFVFLPRRIASVRAVATDKVAAGGAIEAEFRVMDESGALVDALLPVELRVYDGAGRELDGAGYACADGGVAKARVLTNLDDASGDYRVVCRDRASGLETAVVVRRVRP